MIRPTVARVDLDALKSNFRPSSSSSRARPTRGPTADRRAHRGRQGERLRARRRRRWRARSKTPAPICWRAPTSRKARRCARPASRAEILVFGALSVSDLDGLFDCRLTPTISTPGAARAVQAAAAQLQAAAALSPEDRHRHEPARVPVRQPAPHAARAAREREPRARRRLHAFRDRRRSRVAAVRRQRSGRCAFEQRRCAATSTANCGAPAARTVHAANSAALLRDSRVWFDRVRPGLLLYGIVPPPLASTIAAHARDDARQPRRRGKGVRPGEIVGYGARFTAERPTTDRDRSRRLRRRPRPAARRPRLRADSRPARADRRLGVHGHADGRRDRHRRLAGRRGRDHRLAGRRVASTCARWPPTIGTIP